MAGFEVKVVVVVEADSQFDAEAIAGEYARGAKEDERVFNSFVDGSYELDADEYKEYKEELL